MKKIESFFSSYSNCFNDNDIEGLIELLACPLLVVKGMHSTTLDSQEKLSVNFKMLFEVLKSQGITDSVAHVSSVSPMGKSFFLVEVDWEQCDEDENVLAEFSSFYTLRENVKEVAGKKKNPIEVVSILTPE